jgi:hypothetical protein
VTTHQNRVPTGLPRAVLSPHTSLSGHLHRPFSHPRDQEAYLLMRVHEPDKQLSRAREAHRHCALIEFAHHQITLLISFGPSFRHLRLSLVPREVGNHLSSNIFSLLFLLFGAKVRDTRTPCLRHISAMQHPFFFTFFVLVPDQALSRHPPSCEWCCRSRSRSDARRHGHARSGESLRGRCVLPRAPG